MKKRLMQTCEGAFDLATRHRTYDRRLHTKVLCQDPRLVRNCATPEARRLHEMRRAVMRCLQAKKGFMRLTASDHGILFARADPEHDVIDLLLSHFLRRFPSFHIALEDRGRTHVLGPAGAAEYDMPVEEAVARLEASLPKGRTHAMPSCAKSLWESFYESQQIRQRENISLQDKLMPARHRDRDAFETAARTHSRRIGDYA